MKKILVTKLILLIIMLLVVFALSFNIITRRKFISFNFFPNYWRSDLTSQERFYDVQDLSIKMINEDIIVKEHNKDYIEVKYMGNHVPTFNQVGSKLMIENKKRTFSIGFNWKSLNERIEIWIPKNTLSQSNYESVSGDISLYVKGKDVSLNTISGEIDVIEPYERVTFSSVSGDVRINAKKNSSIEGDTISGDIKSDLCNNACGYNLKFSSVSGDFEDKYNRYEFDRKANLTHGKEDINYNITSVSGDLEFGR